MTKSGAQGRLNRAFALGTLCLACALFATSAAGSTLAEAIQRGLARHPSVRLAEAQLAQARTETSIARNGRLPTVTASSGPERSGVSYEVTAAQSLYDWGQVRGQIDQRRALARQQEQALVIARDDAALEIAEAYLDVSGAREQLATADRYQERLRALAEMAQIRLEGRYGDLAETGRVNLALSSAAGERAKISGDLVDAEQRYALLVGEPADALERPSPPHFTDLVANPAAIESAIAGSPLYQRAIEGVRAADAGVREELAARFPKINLEGSIQRREIGGRMIDDSFVGLRLRLGAFQGLSSLQRPELARQRRDAAQWSAEKAARDLRRTAGSLGDLDVALAARIQALDGQVRQTDAVREVYREQFLVARRDIQDLVLMESEHFEADRQRSELMNERLRLQCRLAAQLGRLASSFTEGAPVSTEAESGPL
jgi:adhesin transport system outer membrane protein